MTQFVDPIRPFLTKYGALILDGGLATHLEALGCDLNDDLWSARLLLENPAIIKQAHLDYLWAGADCIITASYQATIPGLRRRGLSQAAAKQLIVYAVEPAIEARDAYWAQVSHAGRLRPLVAASVGPYGAYLADGSEYTGDYGLDEAALADWHRQRWHLLAGTEADLLACETLPSFAEARALLQLVDEVGGTAVYFSFSCRDEAHIHDGTPLADCVAHVAGHPQVVAVGINCTAPRFVPALIEIAREATNKPIVVYPNSGETYDSTDKKWLGTSVPAEFGTFSREWRKLGAALIGGCCRTGPEHIRQIRDRFRYKILDAENTEGRGNNIG